MASAKKKSSAKRNVKYAAKTQTRSAQTSSANHTGSNTSDWVKNTTATWQKGANEWANQSAKMYQMPFGQNEAQDAATSMQSATESMMKMSTDMLQQMMEQAKKAGFAPEQFSQQMPGFSPSAAHEKMTGFARESAEQMSKSSTNATRTMNEAMSVTRENLQVMMDVSNISVSVAKQLGAEWVSYMNKTFAQNTELSKQMLSCRTLNDLFDLGSRTMKTNLDSFFSESVKMSEMLFQCATDVSEPLNERMSETTERMTKAMAA